MNRSTFWVIPSFLDSHIPMWWKEDWGKRRREEGEEGWAGRMHIEEPTARSTRLMWTNRLCSQCELSLSIFRCRQFLAYGSKNVHSDVCFFASCVHFFRQLEKFARISFSIRQQTVKAHCLSILKSLLASVSFSTRQQTVKAHCLPILKTLLESRSHHGNEL